MSGLKRRKHSKARLLCFSGRMLSRHAEGVAGTAVGEGKKSVFWLAAVAFGMSHRPCLIHRDGNDKVLFWMKLCRHDIMRMASEDGNALT